MTRLKRVPNKDSQSSMLQHGPIFKFYPYEHYKVID